MRLNKSEVESWKGEIPIIYYEININSNHVIVRLKHLRVTIFDLLIQ